jgi:hypothetical protein
MQNNHLSDFQVAPFQTGMSSFFALLAILALDACAGEHGHADR